MKNKHYKSSPTFGTALTNNNVDYKNGIIKNIVIVQAGIDKDNGYFSDEFLEDLTKNGNIQKQGIKSRFGHPNMCKTTLGTYIGRYKNFRLIERGQKKVIADLHLDQITKKTQVEGKGISMWNYILEMADNNPDMFGNSIHFTAWSEYETIDNKEVEVYELRSFIASDLVDSPAATDNLFKSSDDLGILVTQFLDENPQIFELLQKDKSIINTFLKRYKKYLKQKKQKKMGIFKKIKDTFITKSIEITLADGSIIEVITENETAQVGDEVIDENGNRLVDGNYLLADGSTFVIENGKISEIKEPEKELEKEPKKETKEAIQELNKTVELLAEKIKELQKKHNTLAKSVKSAEYVPPELEVPQKNKSQDLYEKVQEKINNNTKNA